MDRDAIWEQISKILCSKCFEEKSQLAKLLTILFENMDSQVALKPDRVIERLWPGEIRTKRSADVATEMNRLRRAVEAYYSKDGRTDPITSSMNVT